MGKRRRGIKVRAGGVGIITATGGRKGRRRRIYMSRGERKLTMGSHTPPTMRKKRKKRKGAGSED